MKKSFLILIFFIFFINVMGMDIGINLNGISDWTSEWPFVDIMKISRWWITHNADGSGGWDTGHSNLIPLDENYYPTQIPFDPDGAGSIPPQIVRTVWDNNWLPTGNYTLICDGTGRIRFWGAGSGTFNITNGGTFTVSIPNKGFFAMEIEESISGNHLRNIRLIMPGFSGSYQSNPFHPLFMERIQPFKIIRFMDWGNTNDSDLVNWTDRPKVTDYSYSLKGVPYEIMIDLVNRLDASPWICIPHKATDDYIRQLIILLKNNLTTSKKIYLEYSNETWNWQFSQSNYCEEQGQALGLPSFYGYRWAYHCKRGCDIWRIFRQEFGNTDRLVKIIATQVGWGSGTQNDPYPIQFMLNTAMNDLRVNPDRERADAIAIAPYFAPVGMNNLPETVTVDEILSLCQQDIINMTSSTGMVTGHKNVANNYGAKLICYEGGQHMVRSDSDVLTQKFIQANRDPRIYDLYIDYLNRLNNSGVDEFCHFVDCGSWSRWGMWGAMEYQDQSIDEAHKYRALINWINTHITPTPTTDGTPTMTKTRTNTLTLTCTNTITATATTTATPKIAEAPIAGVLVDGNLNDTIWSYGSWNNIVKIVSGVNLNNVNGRFKAAWDNSYLYIGIEVNDPNRINDSENPWEDDSVEVYLDMNRDRTETYGTDDYQYVFGYGDNVGWEQGGRIGGVIMASNSRMDGYVIEVGIPWQVLVKSPGIGVVYGFDVGINIDDDGGGREGQLMWNGTGDNWRDTSRFGDIRLIGIVMTETPTETRTNTQTGTSTRTVLPTATYTRTPTPSPSPTPSRTPMPSYTRTRTQSPSPIPSRTPTPTYTNTVSTTLTWTHTPTPTWTHTPTPTSTFTSTRTRTPTFTLTDTILSNTPTVTPTWTRTYTRTPTPTNTSVITNTYTETRTRTATGTYTRTGTPTYTRTTTSTATRTPTNSYTSTRTITVSWTQTPTSSQTPSAFATATADMSPTWTVTALASSQPTMSFTATSSQLPTNSWTPTRTATASWIQTATSTQQPIMSFTSTPISNQQPAIGNVVICPNPYNPEKGDLRIGLDITGEIKMIKVKIYTTGFRMIKQIVTKDYENGIIIKSRYIEKMANGIYYLVIEGIDNNETKLKSPLFIFIILR